MAEEQNQDCECSSCRGACESKPGWFMPGEAEKAAEHLGVSLKELFDNSLSVDWWEKDAELDHDVFVLSPAVWGGSPGEEFDADPKGVCVFFKEGRCSIHEVKPFECRQLLHTDSPEMVSARHRSVRDAWDTDENQLSVEQTLGRDPVVTEYFYDPFHNMMTNYFL